MNRMRIEFGLALFYPHIINYQHGRSNSWPLCVSCVSIFLVEITVWKKKLLSRVRAIEAVSMNSAAYTFSWAPGK